MATLSKPGETTQGDRSPKDSATEVFHLVRDYAKQETVEPLKGLANYAKWGTVAALLVGIAVVELMVAVLRAVQTESSDGLDGNWSWVPYVVTLAVAGVVLILTKRGMDVRKAKAP